MALVWSSIACRTGCR